MRARFEGLGRMAEGKWGWIDVTSMKLADGTDLEPRLRFEHPDDDNDQDHSVARTAVRIALVASQRHQHVALRPAVGLPAPPLPVPLPPAPVEAALPDAGAAATMSASEGAS